MRYYIAHEDADIAAIYQFEDGSVQHSNNFDFYEIECKVFHTASKREAYTIAERFKYYGVRVISYTPKKKGTKPCSN